MKRITILLLVIIFSGLFGCESKKEMPKQKETSKQVYLFTEQETDTLMKSVMLDETNVEFTNTSFLLKTKSEQEDLNFSFNLKTPRLFRFYGFNPSSIPFIVYVTPGDTLSYKLDNITITFKGSNAAHYNFFKELYDLKLKYLKYNEELGISGFKKDMEKDYQIRLDFLEQYIKDNNVSDLFYNKIKEVLKFQYISGLLYSPRFPKGAITNYTDYLKDINIKMFNRNDQDDNLYFQLALTNYLNIVTEKNFGDNTYSKEALEYQLDLINSNLVGKTKEYAIIKMLFKFDKHLSTENLDFLQEKIDIYLPQIDDDKHKVVLQKINRRLNTINNQLADKVYNATLLDLDGNNITLKEVLQKQSDKIKVIDFWASWCGPCIKEIKESYLYRKQLSQEKNVEFLYFSIDKNKDNWRKKVDQLQEFGMDRNQYVIPENSNFVLRTFFNVNTIPHYAILDKKNNVVLINATSTRDTLQFNNIIKKIEASDLK